MRISMRRTEKIWPLLPIGRNTGPPMPMTALPANPPLRLIALRSRFAMSEDSAQSWELLVRWVPDLIRGEPGGVPIRGRYLDEIEEGVAQEGGWKPPRPPSRWTPRRGHAAP